MWCWYHGAPYRGYQAQALGPTVQQTLLDAMARIGLHRNVVASGRTDAGVHARMQVLSFRLEGELPVEELPKRLNEHLPPTLGVALVLEWHSRHCKCTWARFNIRGLADPCGSWQALHPSCRTGACSNTNGPRRLPWHLMQPGSLALVAA